jgi:hypothetical protein
LPNSDVVVGRGIEEARNLTVPTAPEGLLAGTVSDTDCALGDARVATLRLFLGSANKLFA